MYCSFECILVMVIGLFWVVWSGGFYVVGSYFLVYMILKIGYIGLMWSVVVWVLIGGLIGVVVVKG